MLRNGYEHLTRHVSALFCPRSLVLDVDPRGALLDEQLGQLHYGGKATMARVCIGDDGAEVIDVRSGGELFRGETRSGFALLAVMEELSLEEVLDL
jgi:hypothetical protein